MYYRWVWSSNCSTGKLISISTLPLSAMDTVLFLQQCHFLIPQCSHVCDCLCMLRSDVYIRHDVTFQLLLNYSITYSRSEWCFQVSDLTFNLEIPTFKILLLESNEEQVMVLSVDSHRKINIKSIGICHILINFYS